jgi:hypothetical protein
VQATAASLHTEDAKASVTIENKLVNDLSTVVNGAVRSPFDLALFTPEAKNLGGDAGFTLGGGQAAGYATLVDGISADTSRALQKTWVTSNSRAAVHNAVAADPRHPGWIYVAERH